MQRAAPDIADAAAAPAQPGSNFANQLFWVAIFAMTLFSCRHRLHRLAGALMQPIMIIVAAYLAVAFASVLWSPVPSIAFRRASLQFIVLATVLLPVLVVDDRKAQIDRLMAVFLATAIVNIFPVVLLPAGRLGHEGIYSHKNELGLVAAYAFIFCLYGIARLRGLWRLLPMACAAFTMVELVLSQSKTSLGLALLIPMIALVIVGVSRFLRLNALFTLAFGTFLFVIAGVFVAYLIDFSFADLSMLLFDDTTFTGRTVIWDFMAGVIGREPLLGQGYGSFWDIGEGSILKMEAPGFVVHLLQGHNGYIDVAVELGIVGVAILLMLLTCILYNVSRRDGGEHRMGAAEAWLFVSVVIIGLCHNMLESSWFRGYSVVWMIFLLAGAWAQPTSRMSVLSSSPDGLRTHR